MSKKFLTIIIIFLSVAQIKAQGNPSDNKNIGLCNLYADTLTFEQLKECRTITIKSDKNAHVTSFTLSYYLANQMNLNLIHGFGETISKEDWDQLLSIKPKSVFIEEVLGECDTEILILGHRSIYLK